MQIGRLAGSDGVNVFEPIEVHGVVPNRQLTAVDLHESIEHYLPVPFIDLCQKSPIFLRRKPPNI